MGSKGQGVRKGSPKVGNVSRSQHRRNRYRQGLRDRDRAWGRIEKERALTPAEETKAAKVRRMLDEPKTKAGRRQGRPIT